MTEQQENQIKSTLKSLGWKYIKEIIEEEAINFDEPIEKNSMEEVGKEYVARFEARKKVYKILKRLESFDSSPQKEKVIYK